MGDIKQLRLSDLQAWYNRWYEPNNAIVVVVGDVQPEAVKELAQEYFGQMKQEPIVKNKVPANVSSIGQRRIVVRVPAKLPWLVMGYNVPVIHTVNAKNKWQPYALALVAAILGGGDSSRLYAKLVRGKQIASGANAGYSPFRRLNALFVLSGTPAQKVSVNTLKKEILEQVKKLQEKPVSAAELKKVKTQFIADNIYEKDDMINQANWLGQAIAVGLTWQDAENFVDDIKAITPEQLMDVAKMYLTKDRLTVAELQPLPMTKSTPNAKRDAHENIH